nr:pilus assembly protein TadG-related protein [Aeoliella straminimaris]
MYLIATKSRHSANSRRGAITILSAVLAIVVVGMVAFAVDIGYILSSREEVQRTADAAALAATWEFVDKLNDKYDSADCQAFARTEANDYSTANKVGNIGPVVDTNATNSPTGDMVFGYINDFEDPNAPFDTTATDRFNAIRVKVRRDSGLNGELPLFFARIFGVDSQALQAQATAALIRDVKGFEIPSDGTNVMILPITLDVETWCDWLDDSVSAGWADNWTYIKETQRVVAGDDGFVEIDLYPRGMTNAGNRGMVDIGSPNNSTSDIVRQVLYGVSPEDLAYHGDTLELDSSGHLDLSGDTGISAGVEDALISIIGEPRVIPIFESCVGPGENCVYTICAWQGIRIMSVNLAGPMSKKHVTIQVGPCWGHGTIPSTTVGTSKYVYSPVILIE